MEIFKINREVKRKSIESGRNWVLEALNLTRLHVTHWEVLSRSEMRKVVKSNGKQNMKCEMLVFTGSGRLIS